MFGVYTGERGGELGDCGGRLEERDEPRVFGVRILRPALALRCSSMLGSKLQSLFKTSGLKLVSEHAAGPSAV